MNNLELMKLENKDGKVLISSRNIAEILNKRHDNVVRDIEKMLENSETSTLSFHVTPDFYTVSGQSKKYKEYFLTKQGFYLYIFSRLGNENFKMAYINKFDEMEAALKNKNPALPQNYKEALEHLLKQVEKNEVLAKQIEQDKPKVNFANSIETSKDSILIGELAKLATKKGIKVGQNRLFQKLREEGYLMKTGSSHNLPTQKSIDLQIMEIKESVYQHDNGEPRITKTTKVTGKGQIYLMNKINEWFGTVNTAVLIFQDETLSGVDF